MLIWKKNFLFDFKVMMRWIVSDIWDENLIEW